MRVAWLCGLCAVKPDDGLVGSDPPKMTKGGSKDQKKTKKKKHTIPLDH